MTTVEQYHTKARLFNAQSCFGIFFNGSENYIFRHLRNRYAHKALSCLGTATDNINGSIYGISHCPGLTCVHTGVLQLHRSNCAVLCNRICNKCKTAYTFIVIEVDTLGYIKTVFRIYVSLTYCYNSCASPRLFLIISSASLIWKIICVHMKIAGRRCNNTVPKGDIAYSEGLEKIRITHLEHSYVARLPLRTSCDG